MKKKLGYDPYQPVLSSANIALSVNNGIGGNESPSHGTSIAATSESLDHDVISRAEKHFEDISNEFDDHIAIILSLSPPIPAVTIDTAMKILSSIQSNPEEEKYRYRPLELNRIKTVINCSFFVVLFIYLFVTIGVFVVRMRSFTQS